MRLLVTRPEPENARTANVLRAHGHHVTLAPMLRIEIIAGADFGPPPWTAVLVSSANGIRAIAAHRRQAELTMLPILTVGRASADTARTYGFTDVISADGDVRDLARLASERFAGARAPLLYLAGEDLSGNLAGALSAQGFAIQTVVAYRAIKATKLPVEAEAALSAARVDGVLHFSRRSTESYLECGGGAAALAPVHYCISARAAEPLKAAGAARIEIAVRPDEESLLALVMPKP